jgi:hypothetical protein
VLPHKLVPEGALPESAANDAKLVVISHDCDLVNSSFEAEPFFEVFLARPKANKERNSLLFNGRNPRRIQFFADDGGEKRLYEISVHEKYRLDRKILETGVRDKTIEINPQDVLVLAKWAMRRYHRPSLPTAFQNRIPSATQGKLRKRLENDVEDLSGVCVRLNTSEELDDAQQYRIILRVVVPPEVCEDVDREKRALSVVSEIRKLLAQCSGISVEDADVASESEITMHDLRGMIRWDFDYLSPEEEKTRE